MEVTTTAQLDALPIGSIVIDSDCDVMHKAWDPKTDGDFWSHMGDERPGNLWLPALLIHVPGRDLVQEAKAEAWDEGSSEGNRNPYRDEEAP